MTTVGIVIPCFNEGNGMIKLIERCQNSFNPRITYLLVNNGSTDNTKQIFNQQTLPPNVKVLNLEKNNGYGFGIIQGLKLLETDFIGWTHADLQTDPADVLLFLQCIDEGADFMKGKRENRPLVDRFFTAGMSLIVSLLFGRTLKDINAQPTIFRRSLMDDWDNPPNDFALDLYIYLIAVKRNFVIKRKSVSFGPRQWGNSHWNNSFFARLIFIGRTLVFAIKLRLRF
jgi:glycosyltransferase involved in cell wall biosynthesis